MAATATEGEPFFYTKGSYWSSGSSSSSKKWYPFWLLQLLTILPLTGFFGLDHLFLRSPLTAIGKLIVNCIGLGIWYWYDLLQVTLDSETVKEFGMSIPIYGPAGIATKQFLGPGEKAAADSIAPWRFMAYCLLTLLPFGLDFFVAGDFLGGGLRFMTSALFFLWPLGFLWGCYNMYRAWITPADLLARGTYRIIPFSFFTSQYFSVKGTLAPGSAEEDAVCREKGIIETILEPVNTVVGAAADIALQPLKDIAAAPGKAYDATIAPLQVAVEQGLAPSITAGVKVAQLAPKALAAVPTIATNVQNKIANASAAALAAQTAAATGPLTAATAGTVGAVGAAAMKGGSMVGGSIVGGSMVGGGANSAISDGAVIFTIAVLVFGGSFLYFARTRKANRDGTPKENDTPPKPGAVRNTSPTS